MHEIPYTGRFAPSPTGPLHFGSLYTALASYLQARSRNGLWLLRIDDLDTPRNKPEAVDQILSQLDAYGLRWDGEVYYSSRHTDAYHDALEKLLATEQVYACNCSRKTLQEFYRQNPDKSAYPGFCKNKKNTTTQPYALRLKTKNKTIRFNDLLQGDISDALQNCGDFIVKRRDSIIAYQLSVVIDDHLQGVNEIVRGIDLLEATGKQIFLQQTLNLPTPAYMHVPIITDKGGIKLSKQNLATPVSTNDCSTTLLELLKLLQQQPPNALSGHKVDEVLQWAITNWRPRHLKKIRAIVQ